VEAKEKDRTDHDANNIFVQKSCSYHWFPSSKSLNVPLSLAAPDRSNQGVTHFTFLGGH
jgi:hypothetical protein